MRLRSGRARARTYACFRARVRMRACACVCAAAAWAAGALNRPPLEAQDDGLLTFWPPLGRLLTAFSPPLTAFWPSSGRLAAKGRHPALEAQDEAC
jgi:hypothetical protein